MYFVHIFSNFLFFTYTVHVNVLYTCIIICTVQYVYVCMLRTLRVRTTHIYIHVYVKTNNNYTFIVVILLILSSSPFTTVFVNIILQYHLSSYILHHVSSCNSCVRVFFLLRATQFLLFLNTH